MYDFHYGVIKYKYPLHSRLLFTDTDSVCYIIFTENIYDDLKDMYRDFDFSNYPKEHPLYSEENKKVVGKFKDEAAGMIPISFVGLRSKLYSLKIDSFFYKQAKKGIPRQVDIRHEEFQKCLRSGVSWSVQFNTIRSNLHNVKTIQQSKVALTAFDDKRIILCDGIKSQPYGFAYKIIRR
jgi:hypothetical protein